MGGRLAGWRRTVRAHQQVFDVILAAALFMLTLVEPQPPDGIVLAGLTPIVIAMAAVACVALALRRRYPVPVLAVTTVTVVVAQVVGQSRAPFVIAAVIAAYTVATLTDRQTAWAAGAASALLVGGSAMLTSRTSWVDPENVILLLWIGLAVAWGDAVRSRHAYVAVLVERARRAERTREEEARRRVAEERLRIARELHDVVAHHIALINVQAGVAGHLLGEQPEQAREALGHVRQASRTVLEELSTLLGVLRRPGDEDAPVEPAPSLSRLDALIESCSNAGQRVHWTLSGQPRPLPTAVDVAAYRIIQESLTNVRKHAAGAPAGVTLRYGTAGLSVEVRDEGNPDGGAVGTFGTDVPPVGTGHGILGMRERATAIGGSLRAGPRPGGGFAVYAELPAPEEVTDDGPGVAC